MEKYTKINTKNTGVNGAIYYIHYNYDRPFKVVINEDGCIKVYRTCEEHKDYKEYKKYKDVYIGFGYIDYSGEEVKIKTNGNDHIGNTIMIHLEKTKYVLITNKIYEINLPEKIEDYLFPVGNNDVPYPMAISKNYIYSLWSIDCLKNDNKGMLNSIIRNDYAERAEIKIDYKIVRIEK